MKCNYKQKAWNLFLLRAFIWLSKTTAINCIQKHFWFPYNSFITKSRIYKTSPPFSFGSIVCGLPQASKSVFTILKTKDCSDSSAQHLELGIIRQKLKHWFYIFIFLKSVEITEYQRLKSKNVSLKYLAQTFLFFLPPEIFSFIFSLYSPFSKIILLTFWNPR